MIEELEIETYLSISKNKFGIYLFDKKKMSTLFKEELNIVDQIEDLQIKKLSNFLDDNIFKIEKLMGNFINNIFVVIETDKIFTTNMSLKKKNYDKIIKFKILENLLTEAKDLFKENYQDYKIMHMLINKYIFNGEIHSNFINNLKSDYICLEINFICIPKKLSLEINQTLDKYQIKINKFLDNRYINSLFSDHEIETAHKFCKVLSGYNENEVNLVSKNQEKIGFFEKFFQLFS